jgi:CheY-like chemotaxis protein
MSLRVLIVDDQALVRAGFRMILDAEEDIDVAGEAADGADAVAEAQRLKPDVILMDVRMPNVDGIEATRRVLAAEGVDTKVVMLTTFDMDEYVYDALRGRERLPPQGRAARAARRGDPSRRAGRCAAGAVGDTPRDRRVRQAAAVVEAHDAARGRPADGT